LNRLNATLARDPACGVGAECHEAGWLISQPRERWARSSGIPVVEFVGGNAGRVTNTDYARSELRLRAFGPGFDSRRLHPQKTTPPDAALTGRPGGFDFQARIGMRLRPRGRRAHRPAGPR